MCFQIENGRDGYVYAFTMEADGPTLSVRVLKCIFMMMHVIRSFIPETCVLETKRLKPIFDKNNGVEKIVYKKELSNQEARSEGACTLTDSLNRPICDIPVNFTVHADDANGGGGLVSNDIERTMGMGGPAFKRQIVDPATIFLTPVCVTHVANSSGDVNAAMKLDDGGGGSESGGGCAGGEDEEDEEDVKKEIYWVVYLRTLKCYNFPKHLEWFINSVDKVDMSNMKKAVNKEYEDVMSTIREVLMFQYENSPNATSYFQSLGMHGRIDPLKYICEQDTPVSLDSVCSIYEAYRSIQWQVGVCVCVSWLLPSVLVCVCFLCCIIHCSATQVERKYGGKGSRIIQQVDGFTDTMMRTRNMFPKSLSTQVKWQEDFDKYRRWIAEAKAIKDPAEKEAHMALANRHIEDEECDFLPDPFLYPVRRKDQDGNVNCDDDEDMFDCMDGPSCSRGPTGIPATGLCMMVDEQQFSKPTSVAEFQSNFGKLPATASFFLTQMMCPKPSRLGMEQFVPHAKILGPLSRLVLVHPLYMHVLVYDWAHAPSGLRADSRSFDSTNPTWMGSRRPAAILTFS